MNLSINKRGDYQRSLGWKLEDGKYRPHRFYLGRGKQEAQQRILHLQTIWDGVVAAWKERPKDERNEKATWDDGSPASSLPFGSLGLAMGDAFLLDGASLLLLQAAEMQS